MAKVYLQRDWTDASGVEHKAGEEIDLPRNTPDEKVTFDHLVKSGLVTRHEPKAAKDDKTR